MDILADRGEYEPYIYIAYVPSHGGPAAKLLLNALTDRVPVESFAKYTQRYEPDTGYWLKYPLQPSPSMSLIELDYEPKVQGVAGLFHFRIDSKTDLSAVGGLPYYRFHTEGPGKHNMVLFTVTEYRLYRMLLERYERKNYIYWYNRPDKKVWFELYRRYNPKGKAKYFTKVWSIYNHDIENLARFILMPSEDMEEITIHNVVDVLGEAKTSSADLLMDMLTTNSKTGQGAAQACKRTLIKYSAMPNLFTSYIVDDARGLLNFLTVPRRKWGTQDMPPGLKKYAKYGYKRLASLDVERVLYWATLPTHNHLEQSIIRYYLDVVRK